MGLQWTKVFRFSTGFNSFQHKILFLPIICFSLNTYSQTLDKDYSKIPYPEIIQNGKNSNKPGIYSQILNANNTTISPGDVIIINHYITGYGRIDPETSKVLAIASASIFDEDSSEVKSTFGNNSNPFSNNGTTGVLISTLVDEQDNEHTLFNDAEFLNPEKKAPSIVFEQNSISNNKEIQPPYKWILKAKNELTPGDYYLTFILTYFNGENWKNDKVELPIKVMTWYERKESIVQVFAWVIVVITIISFLFSIPDFISNIKKLNRDKQNQVN
ncbi:hypothetical protein [Costertonia aggregata]|uniref:DUF8164 domain-containing protein n=1 Tax=Costertonia aggregata TaxID=343403 RepID=A0A7H9AUG2_9FLAO|nr:hypothetical protein [Costertonia aggregata]QLG46825.1 hypothetical protein HYG79_16190 [Costertonia aggregata]